MTAGAAKNPLRQTSTMASSSNEAAIKEMVREKFSDALVAVSEHALALEARVDKLETLVDDRTIATAPSVLTEPEVAAAATTQPANADLADLKAIVLAQKKQMDTALSQI